MGQEKKVVVNLNSLDDKITQNPMKAVSSIPGVVSLELKDNKIIVIGDVDPVQVVKKLKKWYPQIDTVGPAKEEKKPADGGDKKPPADEKEKVPTEQDQIAMLLRAYQCYPHYIQPYPVHNCEENPNACVIC